MGSQRAFLKARESKIDLESKVGKTEIFVPNIADNTSGPGWHCEVCNCVLKDSNAYLDHINGKKHQRALGYSMRVEKSDVDSVKQRLEAIKRKAEDQKTHIRPSAVEDYESKISRQLAEDEERKKARKEQAIERKRRESAALAEEEAETIDPEIAALMGFGGFGGGK